MRKNQGRDFKAHNGRKASALSRNEKSGHGVADQGVVPPRMIWS